MGIHAQPENELESHLHLACWPKSATSKTTWDPIYKCIKWSFEALSKGKHPETGPDGEPLPKGMEPWAGQPLVPGGYRAVIWSIQGDADFYSNTLKLPHWSSKNPCWECDCQRPLTKGRRCPPGNSVKILTESKQLFVFRDIHACIAHPKSDHPIFQVPGVSTWMVRHDALHVLYGKGVGSHLLGSLLHFLCYHEKGKQVVPASQRLSIIWGEVQKVYQARKTPVRLTNLRLSMFCDTGAPHKGHPFLAIKAAELKYFAPCFLQVLKNMLRGLDQRPELQMVECLQAFCNLTQLFDEAPMFLSPQEYETARDLGERFLTLYEELNEWSSLDQRRLFHKVHKHHSMQHMVHSAKDMNPRHVWNFRAEDFVGAMSRLAHSTSFGLKSTQVSNKVALKYKVLLHLKLTRAGFSINKEDLG